MKLILKVIEGPYVGRDIYLNAGRTREVGRGDWSDFTQGVDRRMSRIHFVLNLNSGRCVLADMNSRNGTSVNGDPVENGSEIELCEGDEIEAGASVFVVHLEDEGAAGIDTVPESMFATLDNGFIADELTRSRLVGEFHKDDCYSSALLFQGSAEQVSPAALIQGLSRWYKFMFVADFNRLGGVPEELESAPFLMDSLAPHVARELSPRIIDPAECPAWNALVDESWGQDAMVTFFGNKDPDEFLAHLRKSLTNSPTRQGAGIAGYCWPSVLGQLLENSDDSVVGPILPNETAILIEDPDGDDVWQVFGHPDLEQQLRELGLNVSAPEAELSQPS
ncbi:MAG: FHA domain-containing protein [Planctomycetota bacterium]|nr:FHA domain-containing protein [Planctomycetota bacterium]